MDIYIVSWTSIYDPRKTVVKGADGRRIRGKRAARRPGICVAASADGGAIPEAKAPAGISAPAHVIVASLNTVMNGEERKPFVERLRCRRF